MTKGRVTCHLWSGFGLVFHFAVCDALFLFCVFSDDDLITIFDSSDLSFAIQCSRILKLTLFGKLLNEHFLSDLSFILLTTSR